MILAGGVLTYYAVGLLLIWSPFVPDLQRLIADPQAFVSGYSGAEVMAPFVLLLVPAVLGALGTRAMLRTLFAGLWKWRPARVHCHGTDFAPSVGTGFGGAGAV